MENQLREALLTYVKQELGQDHSGHGIDHALRVAKLALKISEKEGGDPLIIEAAALLHDTVDHKLFPDLAEQELKAMRLLLDNDVMCTPMHQIVDIMMAISYRNGHEVPLSTIEGKIVRDADRLEALGAMGIIRTIEYGASKGRPFYCQEDLNPIGKGGNETSLSHFYDKLLKLEGLMCTETGKAMAKERSAFLKQFLDEFYKEVL